MLQYRNVAAFTGSDGSNVVPFVSINTFDDETAVDITVRSPGTAEKPNPDVATIRVSRDQFWSLIADVVKNGPHK